MAKNQRVLKVFVASPGDLAPERDALEEVIKELNDTWSETLRIGLALVKWETHAFPGFGADGQDVVNKEIGDDYDIFIGMLWTRFGTPTARAESGTEEEFQRAYSRYRADPTSVKLMFYFKEEPISPRDIDIAQFAKVKEFQERVRELGGLDWSFEDLDDCTKYLRMHLARQVIQFSQQNDAVVPAKESPVPAEPVPAKVGPAAELTEGDEGFLDLVEEGTEQFEILTEVSERMTELMVELGENVQTRGEELKAIDFSAGTAEMKKGKQIINLSAQEVGLFAKRMEEEVPRYRESYSRAMEAYGRAASLLADFRQENSKEVEDGLANVRSIREAVVGSRKALAELREIMKGLPRVTTRFNRAKRQCVDVLDALDREMESGLKVTSEVEALLQDLLSENGPDGDADSGGTS